MAKIDQNLEAIRTAVYGEEVRGAIHDGIKQCYQDLQEFEGGVTEDIQAFKEDVNEKVATVETYDDELQNLKSAIDKVVASNYVLMQNAHKYDAGSWILSPNLVSGKKYRIVLVPNTTFTCNVITIGTNPYASGVVDTLGTNVSCISGTPISYDVDVNTSGIGYVRMPSQSANFSSVAIYEQSVYSRAVLYDSDMVLTDEQQSTARDNIGSASVSEVSDAIDSIRTQLIGTKTKKTVNASTIFLTESRIYGVDVPYDSQEVTVYGRNRFDNAGASYSFSGYSSQQTLTKDSDGISVQCRVTQTNAYLYAYTEYTAEFTGKLFFSCDADCSGNIADVCVLPLVNGVAQTRLYGKGRLFESLDVAVGDTVRLAFYTHMGTDAANIVTYKKIMLEKYIPAKKRDSIKEKMIIVPNGINRFCLHMVVYMSMKCMERRKHTDFQQMQVSIMWVLLAETRITG